VIIAVKLPETNKKPFSRDHGLATNLRQPWEVVPTEAVSSFAILANPAHSAAGVGRRFQPL